MAVCQFCNEDVHNNDITGIAGEKWNICVDCKDRAYIQWMIYDWLCAKNALEKMEAILNTPGVHPPMAVIVQDQRKAVERLKEELFNRFTEDYLWNSFDPNSDGVAPPERYPDPRIISK